MNMIKKILPAIFCLVLCGGCAAGTAKTKERFFWPPLPDTPRVEWISIYAGKQDLVNAGFVSALLGEEKELTFGHPIFTASDGDGRIYTSDHRLGGVVVIDLKKRDMHMLGGEGLEPGFFTRPTGLALDMEGNLYAGDTTTKKISIFNKEEKLIKVLDLSNEVKSIGFFAIDKQRKLIYLPDLKEHKIYTFDLTGKLISSFGGPGNADGYLSFPTSVVIDKDTLVVCDAQNARIQRFSLDGKFISKFGNRGDGIGDLSIIKAAAVDSEGHIYVTDGKLNKITIFNSQGESLLIVGGTKAQGAGEPITPGGFLGLQGIFIDQNDTIYVVDNMNKRIQIFQYMNEKWLRENPVVSQSPPGSAKVK